MEIKNNTAIITGGASGLGEATARLLNKLGAKVAILDRDIARGLKVADEISGLAINCDITNEDSVITAFDEINKILGPARIIVNCAGIIKSRRMINKEGLMPLNDFKQVIDVNLTGTFNVMQKGANSIMSLDTQNNSTERGIIINTASVAAYEGQIGQTAYSASKGGIIALTLPAARELASFGIRVMAIAPGLVNTPMFAKLSNEAKEQLVKGVPYPKRLANPNEFAKLVVHIIENEMLNGEVIRLDGALRMQAK